MSRPYYRPSGRVAPAALPFAVLLALAILPGAWAYAWVTLQIPFGFSFFITPFYAAFLGALVKGVVAWGRVRNPGWITRASLVFALLGWYSQWAAWLALKALPAAPVDPFAALHRFWELAFDPAAMLRLVAEVLAPATELGRVVVPLFWLAELLVLLVLPARMGRIRARQPFCEASDSWARRIRVDRMFAQLSASRVLRRVEADPRQLRAALVPLEGYSATRFARAVLYRCEGPDSYLSLANVRRISRPDRWQETAEPLFELLRLPDVDADEWLRHWTEAPGQGPEAAAPAPDAAPVAAELAVAIAHLQARRFGQALAEAAPAARPDNGAIHSDVRTDAVRICALACQGMRRWREARSYWQRLHDETPNVHDALQLANSCVMAGAVAEGIRLFAAARERNIGSGDMPPAQILSSFVTALTEAGHAREGKPYADDIRRAYLDTRKMKPALRRACGIAPLSEFLELSLPVIRATLAGGQARDWYASMLPRLNPADQAVLGTWLEGAFAGRPGAGATS